MKLYHYRKGSIEVPDSDENGAPLSFGDLILQLYQNYDVMIAHYGIGLVINLDDKGSRFKSR